MAERRKILFIVNPRSGKMSIKNHIFNILKSFSDENYEPTVLMTTARGDASEIAEKNAYRFETIVVCGGDGTLNEVVTGLMRVPDGKRPNIGFIPVGTTNDLADTLKLPKTPSKAADVILHGKPSENDVGLFNGERYFNYVASCGAFTAASYSTPQDMKNSLGHMAYVLEGIKSLNEIKPIKMSIKCREFNTEGEFIFGGITNAMSVGGIYKFDPKLVNLNDGTFEAMFIRSPKNPQEMVDIFYGLANLDYDENQVVFFKTSKIEIEFETPVDWTVDGEYAGSNKKVCIENLPGAVKIFKL